MKSESAVKIEKTIEKLEKTHEVLCSLSLETAIERSMFFRLNAPFEDAIIATQDRLSVLSIANKITDSEWDALVVRVSKLYRD
jgi:hypothetical protein